MTNLVEINTATPDERSLTFMIYTKLEEIIKQFNEEVDLKNLPANAHIKNDVGLDSIEIMELIGVIEDEFDLEIPERAIRELQCIDQIVGYIEAKNSVVA